MRDAGAALRALMAADFSTFAMRAMLEIEPNLDLEWNWHHDLICDRLVRLWTGDIQRLLICVPPRSLKSLLCSVLFPAWVLGRDPAQSVMCVSYAQSLSEGFARQCRQLMESPLYNSVFDTSIRRERRAVADFWTTGGGKRIATSVGGTLTGRGGDLIILDDPMKPEDANSEVGRRNVINWFGDTLVSRPNSKKKLRMLVIMQRLHEQDLAAELIDRGGWEVLSLPAIAAHDEEHRYSTITGPRTFRRRAGEALHPAREPIEILEQLRADMGAMTFNAQYLQSPVPAGGNLIKRAWLQTYDHVDRAKLERVVISWDTALTINAGSDYSAGTVWGTTRDDYYLLDLIHAKLEFPDLRRAAIAAAERWKPAAILIEDKGSGASLGQDLIAGGVRGIQMLTPIRDKASRAAGAALLIEQGRMWLPGFAPWLETYTAELCGFPAGRHDDIVDSTAQALNWLRDNPAMPGILAYYRNLALEAEGVEVEW